MNISSNNISIKFNTGNKNQNKTRITEKIVTYAGDVDYEKNVVNKPTLNGKELVGNVTEDDPTMQAISLEELNKMFNSVFK